MLQCIFDYFRLLFDVNLSFNTIDVIFNSYALNSIDQLYYNFHKCISILIGIIKMIKYGHNFLSYL